MYNKINMVSEHGGVRDAARSTIGESDTSFSKPGKFGDEVRDLLCSSLPLVLLQQNEKDHNDPLLIHIIDFLILASELQHQQQGSTPAPKNQQQINISRQQSNSQQQQQSNDLQQRIQSQHSQIQTQIQFAISNPEGKPAMKIQKSEKDELSLIGIIVIGRPILELVRKDLRSLFLISGSAHVGALDSRCALIRFTREIDCIPIADVANKHVRIHSWMLEWNWTSIPFPQLSYHTIDSLSLIPIRRFLASDSILARRTRPSVRKAKIEIDFSTSLWIEAIEVVQQRIESENRPLLCSICSKPAEMVMEKEATTLIEIETDFSKPLLNRLWIEIEGEELEVESYWQRFEYENRPIFFSNCAKLGHNFERRRNSKKAPEDSSDVAATMEAAVVVTPSVAAESQAAEEKALMAERVAGAPSTLVPEMVDDAPEKIVTVARGVTKNRGTENLFFDRGAWEGGGRFQTWVGSTNS